MTAAIERAVRAAEKLFDTEGLAGAAVVPEPEGADAVHAAVARLGELFARLPGQMRQGLERQRENGGNLSTDRLQGLPEIAQNADDLGASQVRILPKPAVLAPQRGQLLTFTAGQAIPFTRVDLGLVDPQPSCGLGEIEVLGDLSDREVTATAQLDELGLELQRERAARARLPIPMLSMMDILPGLSP